MDELRKTPGVYPIEKNGYPKDVVEVPTAIPAFIGHTEFAKNGHTSLAMKPCQISSLEEFHWKFGGPPRMRFALEAFDSLARKELEAPPVEEDAKLDPLPIRTFTAVGGDNGASAKTYRISIADDPMDGDVASYRYALYAAMRLFFQNGGGPCWIVSVGGYDAKIAKDALIEGVKALRDEPEPKLVVIPETTRLIRSESIDVQQQMLKHCGADMKNRFAILDIFGGHQDFADGDPVTEFRNALGGDNLDYGAAYYPWLNSTIYEMRDFDFRDIEAAGELFTQLLKASANPNKLDPVDPRIKATLDEIDKINAAGDDAPDPATLDNLLRAAAPLYVEIMNKAAEIANCLPPAAAMAGVYTTVDNAGGVWQAPANVSLNSVLSATVNIDNETLKDLSVTPQGKSINAIRASISQGVMAWGARTLDGNSLDWRYINVRRTMLMIEESIRLGSKAYMYEPNTASTWTALQSMIENFLTHVWNEGGLIGATPEDVFKVSVGLGSTMTQEDILEGVLRVSVRVAVTRPAEFIEITFQQQMQK